MLIKEIITESDIAVSRMNALMDLIAAYRNKGVDMIPMAGQHGAVTYLRRLGFPIDTAGVMQMVTGDAFADVVERSDSDRIVLKSDEAFAHVSPSEEEKSQKKVEKMATKVAKDAIKKGDSI